MDKVIWHLHYSCTHQQPLGHLSSDPVMVHMTK